MRVLDERWILGLGSRKQTARLRIVLFHHAGGSASSYQLNDVFPDEIEVCSVQLPGRENRFAEPFLTSVDDVVDELTPVIEANADLPYVYFGHNMGALIAFCLARRLPPWHLFVSSHRAPHLPAAEPLHDLPEDEFAARLTALNPVLLDPDLRDVYLPILRADLTLCETYDHQPAPALPCPITAFGGREDELVDAAELHGWGYHTSNIFEVRLFPGEHFYLRGAEHRLVQHIRRRLAAQRF
jgi:medium-chain acyl-[acyl-carrier-protein] hydrolase